MLAGKYNFTIEQRAQLKKVFRWEGSDSGAINLAEFDASFTLWDKRTGNQLLHLTTTPSLNGDVLTLGGELGTISLFVSSDTTDELDFKLGSYVLEVVEVGGEPDRLLEGTVSFSRRRPA